MAARKRSLAGAPCSQPQAKAELGLANLSVVTGRVESLQPGVEVPGKFDVIVSRAFAELTDFVTLARHLVADNGAIWAMKGVRPDGEIERLPDGAATPVPVRALAWRRRRRRT